MAQFGQMLVEFYNNTIEIGQFSQIQDYFDKILIGFCHLKGHVLIICLESDRSWPIQSNVGSTFAISWITTLHLRLKSHRHWLIQPKIWLNGIGFIHFMNNSVIIDQYFDKILIEFCHLKANVLIIGLKSDDSWLIQSNVGSTFAISWITTLHLRLKSHRHWLIQPKVWLNGIGFIHFTVGWSAKANIKRSTDEIE